MYIIYVLKLFYMKTYSKQHWERTGSRMYLRMARISVQPDWFCTYDVKVTDFKGIFSSVSLKVAEE